MRHLPIKLGAAVLVAFLFTGGPASATPIPSPISAANVASPVEKVGYYRRHYGYYPRYGYGRHYYRPYGYYRPHRRYWGYRPYRRYGYRYRY